MRQRLSFLTLIGLALILCMATLAYARSEISGKIVKVSDGDTITVIAPGNHQIKVRLYGIDYTERKHAFGQCTRQFAAQRVAGEQVRVEIMDRDRYERTVGVAYTGNEQNVNKELLSAGIVWFYT